MASILVERVRSTPEYFSTLGVRLQKGRFFSNADDEDHPHVMIMSAVTARQIFGAADPLGRIVAIPILAADESSRAAGAPVTVIGVVDDVKYSGFEAPADGVIIDRSLSRWPASVAAGHVCCELHSCPSCDPY
jgi:hypothetical protein